VSGQGKSKPDFQCSECKLRVKLVVLLPDGTGLPDSLWFDIPGGNHASQTVDFLILYIQKLHTSKSSVILTALRGVTYYHQHDVGFHPDVHVYLLLYACVFWHGEADDLRIT